MSTKRLPPYVVLLLSFWLSACSSLLPSSKTSNDLPWNSYAKAQEVFASIEPERSTLADLRELGIDPLTPNLTLLNHADVTRRLVASATVDIKLLPPLVLQCLAAHAECYAYEIEQKHLNKKRSGNFWLDFLTFERQIHVSGWQFNALFILQNDKVVYKLWSGKPNIEQLEEERNPLGPLQGLGSSWSRR